MAETGVTAGPWKLEPTVEMHGRQYAPWNIVPVDPDVMILRSGSGGAKSYSRDIVSFDGKDADLENGKFIVAAVNVCFSLSPDHPEDVPALIPHLVKVAAHVRDKLLDEQATVTAFDAGALHDVLLALGVPFKEPSSPVAMPPKKEDGDG